MKTNDHTQKSGVEKIVRESIPDQPESLQIGVSRPPLKVDDLPTPEQVFKVRKINAITLISAVLGPSLIGLGVSIGGGEWLLGPLGFGKYGFIGLGFLIMVAAVLQTFYNVENARYTLATGEVPSVGFARTPPGLKLWVPLTLLLIFLGWIWGGWAASAGQSLFAMISGRTFDAGKPMELEIVRIIAVLLLFLSLGLYMFGKKICRTLELVQGVAVFLILAGLLALAIAFVPLNLWRDMLTSIVTPALPPKGIDATTLGSIIGYTGFAAGLNFLMINYYRDHGYGMGHRVGYFSGLLRGEKKEVLPSGVTFRESPQNTRTWKRWFRFLLLDQWGIFFPGALLGMFLASTLMVALTALPGASEPTAANMPVYLATELGKQASWLFPAVLVLGLLILWTTQSTVLEMLIRNTTESAIAVSPRLRSWSHGDPRKFYFITAGALVIIISILIHIALPTKLIQYAANICNLASLIYPFVLIYLNSKLPRPARPGWWTYPILILSVLFFGFFFCNFVCTQITGHPLVNF